MVQVQCTHPELMQPQMQSTTSSVYKRPAPCVGSKGFAMTMKVKLVVFLLLVSAEAGEHRLFCGVAGCSVRCEVR